MKPGVGAVRMLVLLLVCGAARAGAAGGARGDCTGGRQPKITTNGRYDKRFGKYRKPYGGDFLIYCSGNDITSLKVEQKGLPLQAIAVNTSTIEVNVKNLDINIYTYNCTDIATGCEHSVTVGVYPAVSVESARVLYKLGEWRPEYLVPLGEEHEVLCSGHDSASLAMYCNGELIRRQVVNRTTLKYKAHADYVGSRAYWCKSTITTTHGEEDLFEFVSVKVDYYPACKSFRCVIYDWSILECEWQYSTGRFTYNLFYTDLDHDDKRATLLCDRDVAGEMNITCKRNIKSKGRKSLTLNQNISLLLMTCREKFCYNETYYSNTNLLVKVYMGFLNISQTTSHEAVLEMERAAVLLPTADDVDTFYSYCDTCVYKVEFRLTAFRDGWRQADTSSVRCEDDEWCKFTLPLPYPDTEYEVRVSVRHKDATDDRVWSEPTVPAVVRTKPRSACACDAETHAATEPTVSAETASCEACTLIEDTINETWTIKNKIKSSLKEKLARAKEISELLTKSEEIAERLKTLG